MAIRRKHRSIAVGGVCLALTIPALGAAPNRTAIVAPEARKHDAGYAMACEDLAEAIRTCGGKVSIVWRAVDAPLPPGNLILVGRPKEASGPAWQPSKPEGYRIAPVQLAGRQALIVEGDERGTMYALFKLAERIRLGDDMWKIKTTSCPAFPIRIFSEEGQLLDIPDRGYYTDEPPYVNEELLRDEVDEAKRMIEQVVRLGYNAVAVLHLGVEEYIDYRHLDKKVYPPNDRHRARSVVFCKYLKELCDHAHALHVDVYLQVYEIQYPPQLHELYGIDLDSPNIARVIHARYKELFERVPLDGMIITATETHPRVGYKSKALWRKHGRAGAARMITMYHNACQAAGKRCMFRLWRIASDVAGLKEATRDVPKGAMLSIKNTGGDFWLNWPTTDAITSGVARTRPMVVVFDTFRQYDGWSRLFIYMKRWGQVVRTCRGNGVVGLNAWGPWAEGCIWPDHEPGYLSGGENVRISWRGHWRSFRMFTRGFTPGQANVYLLAKLGWDPNADPKQLARDFAALHVGSANAEAAAEALLITEDAFVEEYIGQRADVTHPVYIKWTMVFSPRANELEKAYKKTAPKQVLQSNARALEHVDRMEAAFARTDPSKAPDAERYARFKEGVTKTALYLRTFYLWRECWWRHRLDRDLKGKEKAANATALQTAKAQLMPLFDQWERYPEEAGFWRVTYRYGRPEISPAFPYWYPKGDTTMETSARSLGR